MAYGLALVAMAKVMVWNPHDAENPRKKKALSREQAEKRQAKAVRFLRDVVDDPDLADEIEDLSVQEYARRKGFEVINNPIRKRETPMNKQGLQEAVKNLTEAVKDLKRMRSNPAGQHSPSHAAEPKSRREIFDAVEDAAAAIADDDVDEGLEILNGLLDEDDED
jgi:hypothetical protein